MRVPRSQGPKDLKVTFKYELDSKEGPSCIHIGIQIIICIWIVLFIYILILRIHFRFHFENEYYSYLFHIQKTNTIRICSKITICPNTITIYNRERRRSRNRPSPFYDPYIYKILSFTFLRNPNWTQSWGHSISFSHSLSMEYTIV